MVLFCRALKHSLRLPLPVQRLGLNPWCLVPHLILYLRKVAQKLNLHGRVIPQNSKGIFYCRETKRRAQEINRVLATNQERPCFGPRDIESSEDHSSHHSYREAIGFILLLLSQSIIMVNPLPDKVKACLSELTAAQQVTLRGYIGTLRAEIKDLEEQLRTLNDPDPHAHYHGHEVCHADHSHKDADHGDEHGHDHKKDDHDHSHGHDHKKDDHDHSHGHEHKKEDKKHDDDHSHSHGHSSAHDHSDSHDHHKHNEGGKCEDSSHEHKHHEHEDKHEHKHDHHDHEHQHGHSQENEEGGDIPAWKKRALESGDSDPMAAPFGGNWSMESSLNAKDGAPMEE